MQIPAKMGHIFGEAGLAKLTGVAELYVFSQSQGHIEGKDDGVENLHRGFIQRFDERQLFPSGEHAEERAHPQGVAGHPRADPGVRPVPSDPDASLEVAAGERASAWRFRVDHADRLVVHWNPPILADHPAGE